MYLYTNRQGQVFRQNGLGALMPITFGLGDATTDCIKQIQGILNANGLIGSGNIDGKWNSPTSSAMDKLLGPDRNSPSHWAKSGNVCALVGTVQNAILSGRGGGGQPGPQPNPFGPQPPAAPTEDGMSALNIGLIAGGSILGLVLLSVLLKK